MSQIKVWILSLDFLRIMFVFIYLFSQHLCESGWKRSLDCKNPQFLALVSLSWFSLWQPLFLLTSFSSPQPGPLVLSHWSESFAYVNSRLWIAVIPAPLQNSCFSWSPPCLPHTISAYLLCAITKVCSYLRFLTHMHLCSSVIPQENPSWKGGSCGEHPVTKSSLYLHCMETANIKHPHQCLHDSMMLGNSL